MSSDLRTAHSRLLRFIEENATIDDHDELVSLLDKLLARSATPGTQIERPHAREGERVDEPVR